MAWVAIYRLHQGIGLEAFWRRTVTIWTLFTIWPRCRVYTFMLWMCLREWRDRGPKRKREDTVIVTAL